MKITIELEKVNATVDVGLAVHYQPNGSKLIELKSDVFETYYTRQWEFWNFEYI